MNFNSSTAEVTTVIDTSSFQSVFQTGTTFSFEADTRGFSSYRMCIKGSTANGGNIDRRVRFESQAYADASKTNVVAWDEFGWWPFITVAPLTGTPQFMVQDQIKGPYMKFSFLNDSIATINVTSVSLTLTTRPIYNKYVSSENTATNLTDSGAGQVLLKMGLVLAAGVGQAFPLNPGHGLMQMSIENVGANPGGGTVYTQTNNLLASAAVRISQTVNVGAGTDGVGQFIAPSAHNLASFFSALGTTLNVSIIRAMYPF